MAFPGWEASVSDQRGFFDESERLKSLSALGDPLERLAKVVDFELFRPELDAALSRSDRAKGGRPAYDAVLMFMCGRPLRCKGIVIAAVERCIHVSGLLSAVQTAGPDAVRGSGLSQDRANFVA